MELEDAVAGLAPGVLRFCTGVTGSASDGEDVAQEALAALALDQGRLQRLGQ